MRQFEQSEDKEKQIAVITIDLLQVRYIWLVQILSFCAKKMRTIVHEPEIEIPSH